MTTAEVAPRRGLGTSPRRGASPAEVRRRLTLTGFSIPAIALMLLVNAYPVAFAAIQSVHSGGLVSLGPFVGAANFRAALTDRHSAVWA